MTRRAHRTGLMALLALLVGCATPSPAPVDDRSVGTLPAASPGAEAGTLDTHDQGTQALPANDGAGPVMTPLTGSSSDSPGVPASAGSDSPRPAPRAGPETGNPAVVALLNRANAERAAGRPERSAASLERALKIEPHNAWLWHRLASLRLEQQRPRDVNALAARSNALARGDRALMARNWRLIAAAHRAQGDKAAARAAEDRARALDPTTS